ncbi:hypothetical protein AN2101.2 [Aspergillus nidulans FGSC A4]|uniref:KAR9-domain-containing protein n=1 Tax=Emericella nidulans (strain FGSC A4 / ATCC 38163 / CBS 112.46 / NRRL 194 / M139) TaxID=227321 RepID=Q5BBH9_EMENI|nr:protein migA [Aspergillus nidulans FGSC A4]EAA64933.1 hypothetical protein AN2101.2 [Aspergillus nidulans FGSC A4]CBF86180.1 TPA: conserved hypothetical protein [Aspergillus nidulans FGSC A4]|eukprot:XP_659705.1 hypothetical protein AN2101.2 [Aspergillus nidulans FGSC A4]
MRAIFTTSSHPSAPAPDTSTSATTSQGSPPPPPPPLVSVSSPDESATPRRIKSKASLRSTRSIGSSLLHEDDGDDAQSEKSLIRPNILRRLSPGLAARVKLLDGSSKTATSPRNPGAVGRIPEEQIKELDSLHKVQSIEVERKGRAWSGISFANKTQKQQVQREPLPQSGVPEPPVAESTPGSGQDATSDRLETKEEKVENTPTTMSVVEPAPAPLGPEISDPNIEDQTDGPTDYEKYIQKTSELEAEANGAPRPPPKDSPPIQSSASSNTQSYFNPHGLHRTSSIYSSTNSIFSFSRSSFSNQISQLTSIALPQPSSLEASIASISNAPAAVKALTGAAEQIQIWIRKASNVLNGLDAEDDVVWAAAAGREGLDGVDKAITKFESLVNVYVKAIEDVQLREDIANVSTDGLETIVTQMDSILQSWANIKSRLRAVKEQVELAMEWEELWNSVLGDVGEEVEELEGLVFEMEAKRHFNLANEDSTGLDINELETIVEETPSSGRFLNKRSSMGSLYPAPPALDRPIIQTPQDDTNHSNLVELFARLQPLRASLDFLPMRLSMFQSRAEKVFPSACTELMERREKLEKDYKNLQADAETLRKELEEDRWIMVFRNAGSQAQKMFESVERSISKLQEGLETGMHLHNPAGMTNRIESYEAKKQHYVPAIDRVLTITQKGVKDRLTVNGEILRLLANMESQVNALRASIKVMDSSLEDIQDLRSQHMRDSISTVLTIDSPATGSLADTPGSSPASSVVMTPANKSSRRGSSVGSAARTSTGRRVSGLPQLASNLTGRKPSNPKATPKTTLTAPSPTPAARKPAQPAQPALSPALLNRPRWNTSTNTNDLDVGHKYKPWTPSLRKQTAPSRGTRPSSTIPPRDPSTSPVPPTARSASRISSRLGLRSPGRTASPSPSPSILDPPPYSKLRRPAGTENMSNTPRSRQSFAGTSFNRSVSQEQGRSDSPTKAARPGTALGHSGSRRISLLPLPRNRNKDNFPSTRSKLSERPPWRG